MIATPPPRFASGFGQFLIGVGLVIPWLWLVYFDRRLRRPVRPVQSRRAKNTIEGSR